MSAAIATTSVPFMDLARLHQPLKEDLRSAFDRVLSTSAFVLGEEVERFERNFAEFCGSQHCIGVNSGTAALTIMLQAAGVRPGDEVIVPAHTFVATALAVRHASARPVCADVEKATGLLDPHAVEAAITPRTSAVIAVHLYGQTCDMDALSAVTQKHRLLLLEDAAQAQGARYRDRRAGALGAAAAFSFYPSKNLGALGDAGAITTRDLEVATAARKFRDLGRASTGSHDLPGYNERLDGLQAALLDVKLNHLDAWNEARRRIAAAYRERLDGVELVEERPDSPSIHHLFPIRVHDRTAFANDLARRGIATRVHYPLALPDQPSLPELRKSDAPVARDWARREVSLPMFPGLTEMELETTIEAVNSAVPC